MRLLSASPVAFHTESDPASPPMPSSPSPLLVAVARTRYTSSQRPPTHRQSLPLTSQRRKSSSAETNKIKQQTRTNPPIPLHPIRGATHTSMRRTGYIRHVLLLNEAAHPQPPLSRATHTQTFNHTQPPPRMLSQFQPQPLSHHRCPSLAEQPQGGLRQRRG